MIFKLVQPLVKSIIRKDLLKGLTRNATWNALQSHGLPKFHKQTYWKVATQLLAEISKESLIKAAPTGVKLAHGSMVEGDFPYDAKYFIRGTQTLYDPDMDRYLTKDMSLYSDSNLGIDGWIKQYMAKWYPKYGEEDLELMDASISLVIHQEGYPY